jgi:hypothetical protein
MRTPIGVVAAIALFFLQAWAQQTTFQDTLLDHLTGKWILRGTIGGKETTHDITAEWVLGHQYVRVHEVSREKDAKGQAAYEAIVFIGWDEPSRQYACLWLDSTGGGGLSAQAIGKGKRSRDEIPFVFKISNTSILRTTIAYGRGSNTWEWRIDDEESGKLQPFARVTLSRK